MTTADEDLSAVDYLQVLRDAHTVAVVGLSADPGKYSHAVPAYLQSIGYRIIPVHPRATTLLGEPVRRSLTEVTEPVDVVAVYRPSAEAEDFTRHAAQIGAKAVWLQEGVVSPAAERVANAAGMTFVQDRCIGRAVAAVTGLAADSSVTAPPGHNPSRSARPTG